MDEKASAISITDYEAKKAEQNNGDRLPALKAGKL